MLLLLFSAYNSQLQPENLFLMHWKFYEKLFSVKTLKDRQLYISQIKRALDVSSRSLETPIFTASLAVS